MADQAPKTCEVCGEQWVPATSHQATYRKTCSQACMRALQSAVKSKPRPPKTCELCGEQWQPTTREQAARNKTCSQACRDALLSRVKTGVPLGRDPDAWVTLECAVCGKTFQRERSWAKRTGKHYCSRECNGVHRGAEWAEHGHKGAAAVTPEGRASAVAKMTGLANPAWKGGVTYRRRRGNYVSVRYRRAPEWAAGMARGDGYVMEHRLVMAQRCGFLLMRSEVVHHLDHDPLNNTPGNLELWPSNASHKSAEHGRMTAGAVNRWQSRGLPLLDAE